MNETEFRLFISKLYKTGAMKHVTSDSRQAQQDTCFFAIKGLVFNGNNFISDVKSKGGICFSDDPNEDGIIVWNARRALAIAAGTLYPRRPPYMVGITGTNGKTSTVNYFMQIAHHAGFKSAAIGTVGVTSLDLEIAKFFDKDEYKSLTSADPVTFFKILDKLAEFGVTHVAFELSSHGLDQDRSYGIKLNTAIFTSFSRDHLDYHNDMDNYLKAKMKILELLDTNDDSFLICPDNIQRYEEIKKLAGRKCLGIGEGKNFTILSTDIDSQKIMIGSENGIIFETKIIGKYQIYNLYCAILSACFCGVKSKFLNEILPKIVAVTGRLEKISSKLRNIFVDYAHTPDAIENALLELKKLKTKSSRLILVFGCGGNRDRGKRPEMGRVAGAIADLVIVTDDNPRDEDPGAIRRDIIAGSELSKRPNFKEIAGRADAIKYSIDISNEADIILIAGKGHENYQIINGKKFSFDDKEVAENYCISKV